MQSRRDEFRDLIRRVGWLACFLLLALPPVAWADSPSRVSAQSEAEGPRYAMAPTLPDVLAFESAVPDSVRLKVLAMLAEGNVKGAVQYYLVATGARQAPQWLQGIQWAFGTANRVAGRCGDVAKKIFEGFRALGQSPQYLKITSTESELLAFEVDAGVPASTVQISNNNYHVAVRIGSRIYDAFTGPRGLAVSDYLKRLFTPEGKILMEEVSQP